MFAVFLLTSCANSIDFMMKGSVILESGLYSKDLLAFWSM